LFKKLGITLHLSLLSLCYWLAMLERLLAC